MHLYDRHGTLIAEWPLTAYGKANRGDFGFMESSDKPAIHQATMTALRDAGAFLALRFSSVPEVRSLARRASRRRLQEVRREIGKIQRPPISRRSTTACALRGDRSCPSGCVTTTVQEIRQASTGIKSHRSSVVVLGRHNNAADESEDDFVSCVSNNLAGGKRRYRRRHRSVVRRRDVSVVRAAHRAAQHVRSAGDRQSADPRGQAQRDRRALRDLDRGQYAAHQFRAAR